MRCNVVFRLGPLPENGRRVSARISSDSDAKSITGPPQSTNGFWRKSRRSHVRTEAATMAKVNTRLNRALMAKINRYPDHREATQTVGYMAVLAMLHSMRQVQIADSLRDAADGIERCCDKPAYVGTRAVRCLFRHRKFHRGDTIN
jgi:hypothetical protein